MEIDDLKGETRKIKAPDVASLDFGERVRTVNGLVDELKRHDASERRRLRFTMAAFGLVGALIGLAAFTGYIDPGVQLGRLLLVLIYGLLAAVAAVKYSGLARVDYAEPAYVFLKCAEKRYRFIAPWEYAYIVPGLVAAGLAGWLILASGFDMLIRPARALRFNLFYLLGFAAFCAFSFVVSRAKWKKEKGALHDELVRAVKDFGEGL
jgi:hypothetical protein